MIMAKKIRTCSRKIFSWSSSNKVHWLIVSSSSLNVIDFTAGGCPVAGAAVLVAVPNAGGALVVTEAPDVVAADGAPLDTPNPPNPAPAVVGATVAVVCARVVG
jgi:hypothetical protein